MIRSEVADRRHLGVGDDDGLIDEPHGQGGATLDAGGAVTDDPVEFRTQFLNDARDALFGEGILVPRLRRRKQ